MLVTGDTYRWTVRPITVDGKVGAGLTVGTQPTFVVAGPALGAGSSPDPTSGNTSTKRFPTLTWQPVNGADHYLVYVRRSGAVGYTPLAKGVQYGYAAATDTGDALSTAAGTSSQQYDWFVEAYSVSNALISTGSTGHYTIEPPAAVSGFRSALTGDDLTGGAGETPDSCAATLPAECQNLRQTPVLKWDPSPDTGFYKIYLTFDGANNGVTGLFPVLVSGTMWIYPRTLPDSQAGSAYYWTVVPCTSPNACAPLDHASHAFNKQSNPVVLTSPVSADPGNPTQVADDVTLTWQDYLASEANADTANTSLTSPAEIEAQQYRVQVSTTSDFSTLLDNLLVDQTTYTASASTYPEGILYWRVQAVDGSGNSGNWSATGVFEKAVSGAGHDLPGARPGHARPDAGGEREERVHLDPAGLRQVLRPRGVQERRPGRPDGQQGAVGHQPRDRLRPVQPAAGEQHAVHLAAASLRRGRTQGCVDAVAGVPGDGRLPDPDLAEQRHP